MRRKNYGPVNTQRLCILIGFRLNRRQSSARGPEYLFGTCFVYVTHVSRFDVDLNCLIIIGLNSRGIIDPKRTVDS